MCAQENRCLVDIEIVVENDIGSSLPLNKGDDDNSIESEIGESSVPKEALIKTNKVVAHNTSRNETVIFYIFVQRAPLQYF